MTWLMWRQHRGQLLVATTGLAAFAVLLLVSGLQIASQYREALTTCAATDTCGNLAGTLTLGSPVLFTLMTLTVGVPAVLGLFWGAPLVARELETSTCQYVWMQAVTRRRWVTVKTGWLLVATVAYGGAVAGLVTWWSGPNNALEQNRFEPSQFDVQGIVPIGYSLFAVALGLSAGTILRRTLPALAVTVLAFTAVRVLTQYYLRPRYLAPLTRSFPLNAPAFPAGSSWNLDQGSITPDGRFHSGSILGAVDQAPAACRGLLSESGLRRLLPCLTAHGYQGYITYQPAARYWTFQFIETGIFVTLAIALTAVTAIVLLARDA